MSAFRIICLPLLANVNDQHLWQTNAFAAVRDDKRVMWPFAKLLWTHVNIL